MPPKASGFFAKSFILLLSFTILCDSDADFQKVRCIFSDFSSEYYYPLWLGELV
jgi:hypothetical protein